jgi:phosphonoacetaldehyde hydrolase
MAQGLPDQPPRGQRYRGPLRAVIFDWAGTVLDYGSRAPVIAVMQTFESLEVPVTVDEARGPMGRAKRDHLRAMLETPRIAEAWRQSHGEEPTEKSVDRIYEAFLATQTEVIAAHCELIPGCLAAIEHCRQRGLRLGSSTGYTKALMDLVMSAAAEQGLTFDAMLCADDVPDGRPAPWMCLENARRLGVYPVQALVAVDDTTVGIEAGLNAGMWTVGVAKSGNLVGLSLAELNRLAPAMQQARVASARRQLDAAGAHFVIDSVADLPAALDKIEATLQAGATP